jgi:hypothetical protein
MEDMGSSATENRSPRGREGGGADLQYDVRLRHVIGLGGKHQSFHRIAEAYARSGEAKLTRRLGDQRDAGMASESVDLATGHGNRKSPAQDQSTLGGAEIEGYGVETRGRGERECRGRSHRHLVSDTRSDLDETLPCLARWYAGLQRLGYRSVHVDRAREGTAGRKCCLSASPMDRPQRRLFGEGLPQIDEPSDESPEQVQLVRRLRCSAVM